MDEVWRNVAPLAERGDGRAMMVLLVLEAGLRPQEALALKPDEVDIPARRIRVRSAMKERSGNIGKTKRPASVRDLPMTDRLAKVCAAYSRMRRWWDARRESFGAQGFVIYELRHSNLTKMARYMTVFDLKDWAGWSSIEPAKVYVHRDQSSLEAAVARSQMARSAFT